MEKRRASEQKHSLARRQKTPVIIILVMLYHKIIGGLETAHYLILMFFTFLLQKLL